MFHQVKLSSCPRSDILPQNLGHLNVTCAHVHIEANQHAEAFILNTVLYLESMQKRSLK